MNSYEESGCAFDIPDLWRTANLVAIQEGASGSPIGDCWVLTKHGLDLGLDVEAEKVDQLEYLGDLNFDFPDLDRPIYSSLEDLEAQESISPEPTDESVDERDPALQLAGPTEDIWSYPDVIDQVETQLKVKSWEAFYDSGFEEPQLGFISERGSIALDAAINAHDKATNAQSQAEPGRILLSRPLLTGLSLLGLGRESVLFRYNESEQTFQARIENGRMSGYTMESFASLTANCIHHANNMRHIEKFIDSVYSSTDLLPPLASLANAFSSILSALRWKLGEKRKSAGGLLQLQSLLHGPGLILSYIGEMKEAVIAVESEHELLSKVFRFLQDTEHKDLSLCQIGCQILSHISEPWLRSLGRWLGIPEGLSNPLPSQHSRAIDKQEHMSTSSHDFQSVLEVLSIPEFVSEEDTKIISSVGQGLRLIRSHSLDHPLARPDRLNVENQYTPTWHFSWKDADRVVLRAKEYERSIADTIRKFHESNSPQNHPAINSATEPSSKTDVFDWSAEDFQFDIRTSIAEIEKTLCESPSRYDALALTVMDYIDLDHETTTVGNAQFAPPLSLVPLLSFSPIVHAQSRLVNHACLRLLFKEQNLRFHLNLQHKFSLFGDGVYASRLSHALFDPELQSAQRRKGHCRSGNSGLRLGHRQSWPPPISELRLALMGILTDNVHLNDHRESTSSVVRRDLPGGLNFAIRDIPEDELRRCMDPDSVKALDFLQLKYDPPAPLETVITPSCLEKYDHIFKLLLRGTRMLFVVNRLSLVVLPSRRSAANQQQKRRSDVIQQRFRFEAHHLVTATCSYFFDSIRTNWNLFTHKLDAIESHLDDFEDGGDEHGLENLRGFHETVLDRIMFALFLRARHNQLATLLEEIWSCVLTFARLSNVDDNVNDDSHATSTPDNYNQNQTHIPNQNENKDERLSTTPHEIETLYKNFQTKLRLFISLCKTSSEQRGLSTGAGTADGYGYAYAEFEKEDRESGESRGNPMAQLVLRLEMGAGYGFGGGAGDGGGGGDSYY